MALFLVFSAAMCFGALDSTLDSLDRELNEVIRQREIYLAEKEATLLDLYCRLGSTNDDETRFNVMNDLYNEYLSFNTDSAHSICMRQLALAEKIDNRNMIVHAQLNSANIFCAVGMYTEASRIIVPMQGSDVPEYLLPHYFHVKRTLCGRIADYAAFAPERAHYQELTNNYRDSLMAVNFPGSLPYIISMADKMNHTGDPAGAVEVLKAYIDSVPLGEHDMAMFAWTLADSYNLLGDKKHRKEQLLRSSISDLKSCVREYASVGDLAMMIYEEGDIDRAYKLMTMAMDDAVACNARQRIIELNNFYPKLNARYVETVQSQKRTLMMAVAAITVMFGVLIVLLINTRRQMQKISRARKETEDAYQKLNELAKRLKTSNDELSDANSAIAEISEMKELYIGRYMDQCLEYIDKLDTYRKTVGKYLNAGKIDELKKTVKSSAIVDDELKTFYEQFDKSFLSLFPTFVEDFNRLLQPQEAILPKKDGCLNAELRIFALIRLGITDSDRIAKFLRYSLTTIYNYRTRVRNKALGDRNLLEQKVAQIGRRKGSDNTVKPSDSL